MGGLLMALLCDYIYHWHTVHKEQKGNFSTSWESELDGQLYSSTCAYELILQSSLGYPNAGFQLPEGHSSLAQ